MWIKLNAFALDPDTTEWAFAKTTELGMYWVWRKVKGKWRPAEPTRAWGAGLNRFATTTSAETQFDIFERAIKDHEKRIKTLENRGRQSQ